ncbi:uncharacterized protein LOC132703033 [Cylas formicarius]|uniref:uncharacterized protein LOC132703033 n=1 Tax=Cylas formicarius TaxID=197179 RepID=UPI002958C7C1|nr:uncharacterized protein LOC132703033 [Cylas formicarius]
MSLPVIQNVFELKCLLENINIKLCAYCESGVKQILALITSDNEIVLYYCYGELPPTVKRIPWFSDSHKQIQAICFDASATWLLIVSLDGSLHILPALNIVDNKQKIDCKWSLSDITQFHNTSQICSVRPTSCVWWQTLDCNQNALVGYENGAIVLFSLTDGRCLGTCSIPEPVKKLFLCQDNTLETVSLLINSKDDHQWRLILEHHSVGYLWPPESNINTDDSSKSKFNSLKQLGVDKFSSLRQRFAEVRGNRKDSQSDTASESSHSESNHSIYSGPELLPHLCDTYFAPQYARKRYLFSALYKPTSLLTIHVADIETAPLYVYKLIPKTKTLILTDKLIFAVSEDNTISVISCQLSESRLEGDAEFNDEALVQQFSVNDAIIEVFKVADLSAVNSYKNYLENRDPNIQLPKKATDINYPRLRIDTCLVVTDSAVFKLHIRSSPVQKFLYYVTEENDLEKAEKLSMIFGLNLQELLELCGDLMISRGSFHSGIILYKQAKVHLLKRVLKLAISADCKTLLKFVHLCLSASKVDMSITTKIHIGNVAVLAYTELILRSNGQTKVSNTKDFMKFLYYESHYDQILAVNVACQAGQWNVMTLLAKSKGLQPEVITAIGKILQGGKAPKPDDVEFLYALSEPSLTQGLLVLPQWSQIIFCYIRMNLDGFPIEILKRLAAQLDPSQPSAIALVNAIFKTTKSNSSLDTSNEYSDFEPSDSYCVTARDLVETFLYVIIFLIAKQDNNSFELSLLEDVPDKISEDISVIKNFPDLRLLSCGYEHAAVIRNTSVYTMGVSSAGCLGMGPLLTHTSPPRLVNTLRDLKVIALSISCGRKHTICAADCGVYAWGSNVYGQLGLGNHVYESPYPQILTALSSVKVIDISAGQYHSIALTSDGKVYTWGWGIHGQLGHGNCDTEFLPKLLDFDQPAKQVAAGHAHSLILTCDGKLYGFGSNVFGQLENSQIKTKKSTTPIWILLMPDMYTPVEKIATSYFHNIAVTSDQKVYTWGASPEEVRIAQSKLNQKQNGLGSLKLSTPWRSCVNVYTGHTSKPIKQVAIGYRQTTILDNGRIWWGKNKEEELTQPHIRDQIYMNNVFTQKFWHVSCGFDYTMAIDHTGQVLAWGSPSMIQTILGSTSESDRKKIEGKLMLLRNTKRVVKFPNLTSNSELYPVEISVLPSLAFTFNQTNPKLLLSHKITPYFVMAVENNDEIFLRRVAVKNGKQDFQHIYDVPDIHVGQKTLHYTLQTFFGFFDVENVIIQCVNVNNYQAASKISFLDGHFGDSFGFILDAFKKHLEKLNVNLQSMFLCKDSYDMKEKEQGVEIIIRNMKEKQEHSSCSSPAQMLSSSSSLDSLRQFGDEGGCESPCELGDIRQNITNYVQSLKKSDSSPLREVPNSLSENDRNINKLQSVRKHHHIKVKDKTAKEIIDAASYLVEFYIKSIYISENHILMQNILLRCIEFWLSHNLPVPILEDILLKNLDKYFYPLSILLFCKNFYSDEDLTKDEHLIEPSSSGFLKEFSTKFCLQLCSMVLENSNKS